MTKRYSNIIGFDDAPFEHTHQGPVKIIGTIFSSLQLTGVVMGEVKKDGEDAAAVLTNLIAHSRFREHLQLIMLQGIALAGFNVVDVFYLYQQLNLPVLVVSRKQPDMLAVEQSLKTQITHGAEKWAIIERLGPVEPAASVYMQRVGLTIAEGQAVIKRFATHSHIPEPLRVAHLIAGAVGRGESKGRP